MGGDELEEFEWVLLEMRRRALRQADRAKAARVAAEVRASYVRGQLWWGWFVLLALGSRVANWLWGPWWWSPWVICVTAVWGVVVVVRMVVRGRRYRRMFGDW